jgi:transcriptional regulator with XRE-family HTH domain
MHIKRLRTALGLSQDALAKQVMVSREYLNRLEAGRYDPTLSVVRSLAKALKVTVAELIDG